MSEMLVDVLKVVSSCLIEIVDALDGKEGE